MFSKVFSALILAAFLYGLYCGVVFLLQRHILFPRFQIPPAPALPDGPSRWKTVWLNTSIGAVEAWYLPAPLVDGTQQAPAAVFAHGNSELIDFWPMELENLAALGLGVLLVEYPGYGRSAGTPSEHSIKESLVVAFDWLSSQKEVDSRRVILMGRSLGGGAVCALARERPAAALILMSTFTSVSTLASRFLVPSFIVRDPFDNLSVVATFPRPVLVVHGSRDTLIPYAHGVRLYESAARGKLVTYDCRHNDCPPDWDVFWQDVAAFLREAELFGQAERSHDG